MKGEEGWKAYVKKVKGAVLPKGKHKQSQLLREYTSAPPRQGKEDIKLWANEMRGKCDRLEESFGKEQGTMVPRELLEKFGLERSRISPKEQRIVQLGEKINDNTKEKLGVEATEDDGIVETLKDILGRPP